MTRYGWASLLLLTACHRAPELANQAGATQASIPLEESAVSDEIRTSWEGAMRSGVERAESGHFDDAITAFEEAMKLKIENGFDEEGSTGYEVHELVAQLSEGKRFDILLRLLKRTDIPHVRFYVVTEICSLLEVPEERYQELLRAEPAAQIIYLEAHWVAKPPR